MLDDMVVERALRLKLFIPDLLQPYEEILDAERRPFILDCIPLLAF